jgi:hypothetical protein
MLKLYFNAVVLHNHDFILHYASLLGTFNRQYLIDILEYLCTFWGLLYVRINFLVFSIYANLIEH